MSDQAVKIFEALSGVDEELLERCNRRENRKNAAVYKLLWRYGRTMAACICMIAVGAAAWGGYQLAMGGRDSAKSGGANNQAPPAALADCARSMGAADGMAGGDDGVTSDAEVPENGSGSDTAGMSPEAFPEAAPAERPSSAAAELTAPQMQQSQTTIDNTDKTASMGGSFGAGSGGSDDAGAEKNTELWEKEDALADSRQSISWAEACGTEPFDRYLPAALPPGYEPFSARQSGSPEQYNNIIFKWSDGQQILYLNMTMGEARTREDLERSDGLNQYPAEDFQREMLPEPGPDGQILFTLYYGDGMRIDFGGYVTADEMWEVVEAVSR